MTDGENLISSPPSSEQVSIVSIVSVSPEPLELPPEGLKNIVYVEFYKQSININIIFNRIIYNAI